MDDLLGLCLTKAYCHLVTVIMIQFLIILTLLLIGNLRFEYEYEYKFSVLVFRLYIIMSHAHLNSLSYPPCLKPAWRTRALELSLFWTSKIVIILNLVLLVQSIAPYYCKHTSCKLRIFPTQYNIDLLTWWKINDCINYALAHWSFCLACFF